MACSLPKSAYWVPALIRLRLHDISAKAAQDVRDRRGFGSTADEFLPAPGQ
jgi:hypothetical protein